MASLTSRSSTNPAGADPAPRPSQVILAITRAQHAALRYVAHPHGDRGDAGVATKPLYNLRYKNLITWDRRPRRRSAYRLTPAGRALLAALDRLHPAKPHRAR